MLQAGRIVNVHLPKDRVTQTHQGYGFVEFQTEEDAEYAAKIMNGIRLYGKPIRVNKASADKSKAVEIGAELFIGNLDSMVDERTIFDTFRRFGQVTNAKVRFYAESYCANWNRSQETTQICPKALGLSPLTTLTLPMLLSTP
jgi:RNA recognition motif-containing protein